MNRDFTRHFGEAPQGVVRAPGRVNLIGEHVDYHGLPVLPMALRQAVRVAFGPRSDGMVRVVNGNEAYGTRIFDLQGGGPAFAPGDWGNYLRAAALVVRELGGRRGADLLVTSDLPAAAGLSSSSALVVAVALALLAASDMEVSPVDLAEALARGERLVGTQGGGMDQAVSLGGRAGAALLVEFDPLRWTPVAMPPSWRVVVAHSGVSAEKSAGAQEAYNQRRSDGAEALQAVGGALGRGGATYRDLLDAHGADVLLEVGEPLLPPRLFRRFRHVVTEAVRVEAAVACLRAGDGPALGRLLRASHASLREDCQVSHPRLDALVEAATEAGAWGARLTGAGFGGCMVALTGPDGAASVQRALRAALQDAGVAPGQAVVFQAEASDGARVLGPGTPA